MSIVFDLLCFTVPLVMSTAQGFLFCMGGGGWGYPMMMMVVRMKALSFPFTKRARSLASAAEARMDFMMKQWMLMAPLLGGGGGGESLGPCGILFDLELRK